VRSFAPAGVSPVLFTSNERRLYLVECEAPDCNPLSRNPTASPDGLQEKLFLSNLCVKRLNGVPSRSLIVMNAAISFGEQKPPFDLQR